MGLIDWVADGWRWRRKPQPHEAMDIEAIRQLAREACAYDELAGLTRPDPYAGLSTSAWSPAIAWDPSNYQTPGPDGHGSASAAAPWRHGWNVIEGGDLTPWMSPEERAAVDQEQTRLHDSAPRKQGEEGPMLDELDAADVQRDEGYLKRPHGRIEWTAEEGLESAPDDAQHDLGPEID